MAAAAVAQPLPLPTFLPPAGTGPQPVGTDPRGEWLIFKNGLCHNGQWYDIVLQKFDLASGAILPFDSAAHVLDLDVPEIVQKSNEQILRAVANQDVIHPLTPDRVGLIFTTDGDKSRDRFKVFESDNAFQAIAQAGITRGFGALLNSDAQRTTWDSEKLELAPGDEGRFQTEVTHSVGRPHLAIDEMRKIFNAVSPVRALPLHGAGRLQVGVFASALPARIPTVHGGGAVAPFQSRYVRPSPAIGRPPKQPIYDLLDRASDEYSASNAGSFLAGVKWSQLKKQGTLPPRVEAALEALDADPDDESPDCQEMMRWLALLNNRLRMFYLNPPGDPYFNSYLQEHGDLLVQPISDPLLNRDYYSNHSAAFDILTIVHPRCQNLQQVLMEQEFVSL